MLALYAVLLVVVPAAVILYPLLRRTGQAASREDESSFHAELGRRWEAALSGLKSAELERAIGNLTEEDYRWLRGRYMAEAAQVIKAMELEEQQEQELLATIEREVKRVRARSMGRDDVQSRSRAEDTVEAKGE